MKHGGYGSGEDKMFFLNDWKKNVSDERERERVSEWEESKQKIEVGGYKETIINKKEERCIEKVRTIGHERKGKRIRN